MGDISDVPVTNPDRAQFIANVIFAEDARERAELTESLSQSEQTRLALGTAESEYIISEASSPSPPSASLKGALDLGT